MTPRPTRDEPRLIEIETLSSSPSGHSQGGGDGVEWQVVAVVTLAVVALAAMSVIGISRDAVDPLATTPTSAATSEFLAVDPTEVARPVQTGWPSTTVVLPEEGFPWPMDAAVIVANEAGVHRVAAGVGGSELGTTVVTRLMAEGSVNRAFEVEDGSLVYQLTDGPILRRALDGTVSELVPFRNGVVLEDADMPGADPGRLRLVHREPSDDPSGAFRVVIRSGDSSVSTLVPGGWGVTYRRFTLWTDRAVLVNWIDDVGTSGAAVIEYPSGRFESDQSGIALLQAAGDPSEGGLAWVTMEGIWTPLDSGPRALTELTTINGVDIRGSSVVVNRYDDGLADYLDLTPYRRYDVPVAGFSTVSRFVHSPRRLSPSELEPMGAGPRTCILGLPGTDSHVAPYPDDLTPAQILLSVAAVVDGFAALIFTMDDGSFIVRITFDACVLHVRASGITSEQLARRLAFADVGHTYSTDAGIGVGGDADDAGEVTSTVRSTTG